VGTRQEVGTSDDFGGRPNLAFGRDRSDRWAAQPGPRHPHEGSTSKRSGAPRRASPPRPSLLCGDLTNCHRVFNELRQSVANITQFDQSCPPEFLGAPRKEVTDKWQSLVRRARSLRETLVSLHEMSPFTRDAYEMSADICLRAGDWGEFLKCQQQLVQVIYPALEESDALGGSWSSTRWPEFVSVGIVYFACLARESRSVELSATLRSVPRRFLSSPPVQLSLALLEALVSGNYIRIIRLQALALPSVQLILQARLRQVRERAAEAMAKSYNAIDTHDMQEMLGLEGAPNELRGCLKAAQEKGSVGATKALATWAGDVDSPQPAQLPFK